MRKHILALVSSVVVTAAMAGCAAAQSNEDFSDVALAAASNAFSSKMEVVGSLDFGVTSAPAPYHNPPRYIAWQLTASAGDVVDGYVSSTDGVPDAWLLDATFHVLSHDEVPVANDDGSLTAHVSATLPANTPAGVTTYYLVARDLGLQDASFTATVQKKIDPMQACNVDSDCVAIPQGGCCPNGTKVAVASCAVDAYQDAHACTVTPHPICPLYVINDTRVAECIQGACQMVKPESIACGGFVANAHACPSGYQCQHSVNPDVAGQCVVATPVQPQTVPACIQNVFCIQGDHFDRTVCKCVPDSTN